MAGAGVQINTTQLQRMSARLAEFQGRLRNPKGLAKGIGQLMEAQVKRRIQDEKTAPDGTPWQDWSQDYAKARKGNHSILLFEGRLRDSIAGRALNGNAAVVGASMVYAAVHQYGYPVRNIPPRPYLGLSDENADEIADLVIDWCEGSL